MVQENNNLIFYKNLRDLGIPTFKLTGVLITKPTVQYITSQRIAIHLLISTYEDYTKYQKTTEDSLESVEMSPAHHVLLLTNQSDELDSYATLKKRTKLTVECMNVSYPIHDHRGKVFSIHRLLVMGLKIISSKVHNRGS